MRMSLHGKREEATEQKTNFQNANVTDLHSRHAGPCDSAE